MLNVLLAESHLEGPLRTPVDNPALLALSLSQRAADGIPVGVVTVAGCGSVLHANTEARRIFASRDRVWLSGDRICTDSHSEARQLRRMLQQAVVAGACVHDHSAVEPRGMLLRGSDGSCRLVLVVRPIAGEAAALLLMCDPGRGPATSCALVSSIFRLTNRQAQLAVLLTRGHTLNEAAAAMSVTRNTARTHLRQIFVRLNLRKQADLVRLLLESALLFGR